MMEAIRHSVSITAAGMVTRLDAAKTLGVTTKTMCEWAAKGRGPVPVSVGGRIFYRWDDVVDHATGVKSI